MPIKTHSYSVEVTWTGNLGPGTSSYTAYSREHSINVTGHQTIAASSDPAFRGDPKRYNPEELFVSSLSSCHMLWYLHICAEAGIAVTDYKDEASGTMEESAERGGYFTEVILHPAVTITDVSKIEQARLLHKRAHHLCFIANSVNFPVRCEPKIHALKTHLS